MDKGKIAGVVLAGGRSSRMGQNKALLDYKGAPLLDYMIRLLQKAGLSDIYVSGEFEGDYKTIPDRKSYEGPARAMCDVWAHLEFHHGSQVQGYAGVLYVPVDMPLLSCEALALLLSQKEGAFFEAHYLPVFIPASKFLAHSKQQERSSVRALLKALEINSLSLPASLSSEMLNANTPDVWAEVTGS